MNPVLQSHLGRPPLHLLPLRTGPHEGHAKVTAGLLEPARQGYCIQRMLPGQKSPRPQKISSVRRLPCRQLPRSGALQRGKVAEAVRLVPIASGPGSVCRHVGAGTEQVQRSALEPAVVQPSPDPGRRRQAGLIPPLRIPEGEAAPTQTRANPPVRRTAQDHNITFQSQLTA